MKTIRGLVVAMVAVMVSAAVLAEPPADEVMKTAMANAEKDGKNIFLDFGAPG
jgi:hypothetical protein